MDVRGKRRDGASLMPIARCADCDGETMYLAGWRERHSCAYCGRPLAVGPPERVDRALRRGLREARRLSRVTGGAATITRGRLG